MTEYNNMTECSFNALAFLFYTRITTASKAIQTPTLHAQTPSRVLDFFSEFIGTSTVIRHVGGHVWRYVHVRFVHILFRTLFRLVATQFR